MIKIAENLVRNYHFERGAGHDLSVIYTKNRIENSKLIMRVIVDTSAFRLELSYQFEEAGVYTFGIFAKLPKDIIWRNHELAYADPITETADIGQYKIYSVTVEVPEPGDGKIRGYMPNLPVGTEYEIDWYALVKGQFLPDIPTPAHADLTSEQIATLPPYGEYKEIKSF